MSRDLRFFSGRIEEFTDESISVTRTLASRDPELRTFTRTPATVVKGSLRKGARVSVGYTLVDGVYVAHRILIRG